MTLRTTLRRWLPAAACALSIALTGSLAAEEEEPSSRELFAAAKQALERGHEDSYQTLLAELTDYPLLPYLHYWQMREQLDAQSNESVQAFIEAQADTPLAQQMRFAWLRHLATKERWEDYLAFFRPTNSAMHRCHYHTAQWQTGQQDEAWAGARGLWAVGHSQHSACDGLFTAWEAAEPLDDALRWQRIELAMAQGNVALARFVAEGLPDKEADIARRWATLHEHPVRVAEDGLLPVDGERSRPIALHALKRLAATEPERATEIWSSVAREYGLSTGERHEVAHAIALRFALRRDERALEWFAPLPAESFSESSRGWAVRAALLSKRWPAVRAWIEEMPADERNSERWSYWLARAHEATGKEGEAGAIYRRLSGSRSYYGFLAADRIDAEYNLAHQSLEVEPALIEQVLALPAVVRAGELYRLGLLQEARSEWNLALSGMNRAQSLAAGALASDWQWHDRALLTLARVGHFDDLNIRFPLAHGEAFAAEASQRELDPAWVIAVARQESAMDPLARSRVGALGLMQLMPATGRELARQLQVDLSDHQSLTQPELNIRFGSHYLRQMLDRFEHPILATAAYNAGPHRVAEWYPAQGSLDADIWVDTIPFHETRKYIRRVMAYAVFYDQRLERAPTRLSERMPPVVLPEALRIATQEDDKAR